MSATDATPTHSWRVLPEFPEPEGFGVRPLAVLGWPVEHSLSPAMHNAALARMEAAGAISPGWHYHRVAVRPEDLPEALVRLHRAGFYGLNLTVPHKVQAMGLVASAEPSARALGAVNTLVRTPRGWHGHNTDGYGLATAVRTELGLGFAGETVLLLGAGGAGRAAAVQILRDGAAALLVRNRDPDRLAELRTVLEEQGLAARVVFLGPADPLPPAAAAVSLVVNATSLGLKADDPSPLDWDRWPFRAPPAVYDMIYNPPETRLLAEARARGAAVANGLGMLVWQGARALEIWTGQPVPAAAMRTAAAAALG